MAKLQIAPTSNSWANFDTICTPILLETFFYEKAKLPTMQMFGFVCRIVSPKHGLSPIKVRIPCSASPPTLFCRCDAFCSFEISRLLETIEKKNDRIIV